MINKAIRWWRARRALSAEQQTILVALLDGHTLKTHRNIEGEKVAALHALDGSVQPVAPRSVLDLRRRRLVETNHKFPAAVFLLTSAGQKTAQTLHAGRPQEQGALPVTARNFVHTSSN